MLAASEHEPAPALSARVIVTVGPAVVAPAAVQFVKPAPSVIVGTAVTVNEALKTAVIVEPPTRAPFVALELKPTVHLVIAPAAWVLPAKEIVAAGATAAAIVGCGEAGPGVVSADVLTLIVAAPVVVVFVIPTISSVAAVFFASAQAPPLLASVTVTTDPALAPVAEQSVKPVSRTIDGFAGKAPPVQVPKLTVIVPPVARAPEPPVLNPIVQFAFAPAASEVGTAVTSVTAGSIT